MHIRGYSHASDFEAVGRLLVASYRPGPTFDPWLQPRWEYLHFHPLVRGLDLTRWGVAEVDDRLAGVVHAEHDPGICYLQRRPGCDEVVDPLLDWADAHLVGRSELLGREVLAFYVPTFDQVVRGALVRRGFVEHPEHTEPQSRLTDMHRLARPEAPAGYRLQSIADENDLAKVDRVLWRGFDHEGPSPPEGIEERRFMQSAPNFRPDLTIVAVAPGGEYAAFCGTWVVPESGFAFVEPVATDPDHRRRGVGRAVVLTSLGRAAANGAKVAWVGSDQPFYRALGFETRFTSTLWVRS